MKLLRLDQITGEEELARSIMTDDYKELLSEGAKLKREYIPKLKELGITEVYIKDKVTDPKTLVILKEEVNKTCKQKVQNIISKHTYHHSQDMIEIGKTADDIISNMMEEESIVEQIFDIKERSADIYEHSISTCTLATLVALKMQLAKDRVYNISVGCLLHDLGLRYISLDFENVDFESLSDKHKEEYHKHPIYGYTALKNEDWLSKTSKEIILCHHEQVDGKGYPLRSQSLSLEVKIAAVCDFFDEHICGIGCNRMKVYEVVEFLKSSKNTVFDAKVIDTLLEFTAVYPSGSKVITNEKEIGIVIQQNKGFPERPILQIVSDKDGKPVEETLVKDLLKYNNVFIESVLN